MLKTERRQTWVSIHSYYLEFAYQSYRACTQAPISGLVRPAVEAIRYAYDCIEASTEFIYHMGRLQQLPHSIQSNWLSRHIQRKWTGLTLVDRISLLSYGWRNDEFWSTTEQHQLFEALKRVRDGLTHPIPFGTVLEYEILEREQQADRTTYTRARPLSDPKHIGSDKMRFDVGPDAGFAANPFELSTADAERALEILLLHLIRFEEIFFGRATTWFSIYDSEDREIRSARDLLSGLHRRYESVWSPRQKLASGGV
jgi:hypothetical protein